MGGAGSPSPAPSPLAIAPNEPANTAAFKAADATTFWMLPGAPTSFSELAPPSAQSAQTLVVRLEDLSQYAPTESLLVASGSGSGSAAAPSASQTIAAALALQIQIAKGCTSTGDPATDALPAITALAARLKQLRVTFTGIQAAMAVSPQQSFLDCGAVSGFLGPAGGEGGAIAASAATLPLAQPGAQAGVAMAALLCVGALLLMMLVRRRKKQAGAAAQHAKAKGMAFASLRSPGRGGSSSPLSSSPAVGGGGVPGKIAEAEAGGDFAGTNPMHMAAVVLQHSKGEMGEEEDVSAVAGQDVAAAAAAAAAAAGDGAVSAEDPSRPARGSTASASWPSGLLGWFAGPLLAAAAAGTSRRMPLTSAPPPPLPSRGAEPTPTLRPVLQLEGSASAVPPSGEGFTARTVGGEARNAGSSVNPASASSPLDMMGDAARTLAAAAPTQPQSPDAALTSVTRVIGIDEGGEGTPAATAASASASAALASPAPTHSHADAHLPGTSSASPPTSLLLHTLSPMAVLRSPTSPSTFPAATAAAPPTPPRALPLASPPTALFSIASPLRRLRTNLPDSPPPTPGVLNPHPQAPLGAALVTTAAAAAAASAGGGAHFMLVNPILATRAAAGTEAPMAQQQGQPEQAQKEQAPAADPALPLASLTRRVISGNRSFSALSPFSSNSSLPAVASSEGAEEGAPVSSQASAGGNFSLDNPIRALQMLRQSSSGAPPAPLPPIARGLNLSFKPTTLQSLGKPRE